MYIGGLCYKPGGFLRSPRLTTYVLYFLIFVLFKRQINDDDDDDIKKQSMTPYYRIFLQVPESFVFCVTWD